MSARSCIIIVYIFYIYLHVQLAFTSPNNNLEKELHCFREIIVISKLNIYVKKPKVYYVFMLNT